MGINYEVWGTELRGLGDKNKFKHEVLGTNYEFIF